MTKPTLKFIPGISATSVGRFGGYRGFVFDEAGFLCWNASEREIVVDFDHGMNLRPQTLFRFNPGHPFTLKKSSNWVCRTWRFLGAGRRPLATVHQSLLSPGMLFDLRTPFFSWESILDCHAYRMAFPTGRRNVTVVEPRHYCHTLGHTFDHRRELSRPWIVEWPDKDYRVPLLFVFERLPVSVESIIRGQRINFKGPAGKIAVMPLFGLARPHWSRRADMTEKDLRDLRDKADLWARIMMAYPADCREEYALDEKRGRMVIRNTITHLEFKGPRAAGMLRAVPLPPVLNMARRSGYPVGLSAKPLGLDLPVRYGYYDAVPGRELTYSLPACRYCHETVAPVRVKNEPASAKLTDRLEKYLANPTLTFGGDDTYDADNIQDILHNMRILAWAGWSLPDKRRARLFARIARHLKGFDKSSYVAEKEPVSGQTYLWEKHLWWGGLTNVDNEWYNGMQLAGLWAYVFYGNDPAAALARVRAKWDIVKGLFAYYNIWNDWATGCTWTCVTGRSLWMDGLHYTWHGLLGAARLAKMAGDRELQGRAEYYAAKMLMARYAALFSGTYGQEFLPKPPASGAGGKAMTASKRFFSGYFERGRTGIATQTAGETGANTFGYHVPELLLFYWDHPAARRFVKDYEYKRFPAAAPDWTHRYFKSASGRGPDKPHPQYPSHTHFYQMDMRLMARALMFRESLGSLMSYIAELTGPVMENYLVGSHPVAVIPTGLRFLGNEYDAAAKTLTLEFAADPIQVGRDCGLRIWTRRRPKDIRGCRKWSFDHAAEMAAATFRADRQNRITVFF